MPFELVKIRQEFVTETRLKFDQLNREMKGINKIFNFEGKNHWSNVELLEMALTLAQKSIETC